jgi:hypothetical protein
MRLLLALLCAATAYAAPVSTDHAYADLVRWEGHKLVPYRDQDGWSVGVGHALTMHGEPVKRSYTRAEVYQLFLHDFAVSKEVCRAGIRDFDRLPEDVQLVALGLAWGVGPTGFMRFRSFRLALSYRAYEAAVTELATSRWARQVSAARLNAAIHVLRSH